MIEWGSTCSVWELEEIKTKSLMKSRVKVQSTIMEVHARGFPRSATPLGMAFNRLEALRRLNLKGGKFFCNNSSRWLCALYMFDKGDMEPSREERFQKSGVERGPTMRKYGSPRNIGVMDLPSHPPSTQT